MKNSTVNNTNTHTQNTTTDLTVDFMTGNMVNLLKACWSLRELERLLNMLNGIDEDNRVLTLLRKMDSVLQDLSPLYNEETYQGREMFNTILADDSLGFIIKARLMMGIREDLELYKSHPELLEEDTVDGLISLHGDKSGPVLSFSMENMKKLLQALYACQCLDDVLGLFNGSGLEHDIIDGLRYLYAVIEGITPLYNMDLVDSEEENKAYYEVMEDSDLGLSEKAWLLMGGKADR